MKNVLSPCKKICRIDQFTEICIGCGRTLKEIKKWPRMHQYQRRKIMDRLEKERSR
tara:strand:- start:362 stop:529 length:168 start_codon:yes stop_codon:yes gene_type:complete